METHEYARPKHALTRNPFTRMFADAEDERNQYAPLQISGVPVEQVQALAAQYPELPVLVITGFGDERLEVTALSEPNTGYLDKPFEIPELVEALAELTPGRTDVGSADAPSDDDGMRESVSAYLTVKITDMDRSLDIYDELYRQDGIISCDITSDY